MEAYRGISRADEAPQFVPGVSVAGGWYETAAAAAPAGEAVAHSRRPISGELSACWAIA